MNSIQSRKPKGAPGSTGGQFASRGRAAATSPTTTYDWDALDSLHTPHQEDWDKATEFAKHQAPENSPEFSELVEKFAYHYGKRSGVLRAYQEGIPHPLDGELTERWEGGPDEYGSREWTETELSDVLNLQAGLRDGSIPPRRVVGSGYKNGRKVAEEYLAVRVAELQQSLETEGRSELSVIPESRLYTPGDRTRLGRFSS